MINKIPWQIKLIFLMLLMAVIPGLIISYSVIGMIRDELKSNINGQLIYSSNSIANDIDSRIKKNLEILELSKNIVENPNLNSNEKIALLVSSVEKIDNLLLINISVLDRGKIIEVLNTQKDYIIFANREKKLLPSGIKDSIFAKTNYRLVTGSRIFQPFYEKELRTWIVAVIVKLNPSFFPDGYMTALFSLSDVAMLMETNLLSEIGNVFVSDSSQSKFLSNRFLTDIPEAITGDAASLVKSANRVTLVNNYKGKTEGNYVSCFSRTHEADWIVVSTIKEETAYAVVNEAFLFYGIFIGISIILSIITALVFSKHLSKPIIKMSGVSKEISNGNFDARAEYPARDSIGILNDSLGQMGVQLKKNFAEIEEQKNQLEDYSKNLELKVEDRTNELNESNKELKKAYHRVLELNEEKNEFLGIAAHDLKNPLTAVSAFAEIIKTDKDLPNEQREDFLDEIIKASGRMFSIVKNLLDVNVIEQGKLNTKLENVSIKAVIGELVSQFREAAAKKNINIVQNYHNDQVLVLADYNLTLQIMQNIISNAIKFSPADKNIFLNTRRTDNSDLIEISIKDEGPGFTEQDKKKLFQKFARLSARPTGGEHSTGLGLSIVKKLVEMMNGSIRLESESGGGAEFIITLPEFKNSDKI
jgi:signal transduction histidine kinase